MGGADTIIFSDDNETMLFFIFNNICETILNIIQYSYDIAI